MVGLLVWDKTLPKKIGVELVKDLWTEIVD